MFSGLNSQDVARNITVEVYKECIGFAAIFGHLRHPDGVMEGAGPRPNFPGHAGCAQLISGFVAQIIFSIDENFHQSANAQAV